MRPLITFGQFFQIILKLTVFMVGAISCVELPQNRGNRAEQKTRENDAPILPSGQSITLKTEGIVQRLPALSEAVDPNGDDLIYYITRSPSYGNITNCMGLGDASNFDLVCDYTPKKDLSSSVIDSFVYTADDSKEGRSSVTVLLYLNANNAPVAGADQTFYVLERSSAGTVATQTLGAITSATDLDKDDVLSYSLAELPKLGVLSDCIGLNGSDSNDLDCKYTPFLDRLGADSFTYLVKDNFGAQDTAQVNIIITTTNQAPQASPNPASSVATNPVFGTTDKIKINGGTQEFTISTSITDPDGVPPDKLLYNVINLPTGGTLEGCLDRPGASLPFPDLVCDYTPDSTTTSDSFSFSITDQEGLTSSVTVNIGLGNNTPVAPDVTIGIAEEASYNFSFNTTIGVFDADGASDIVSITGVSPLGSNGTFDGLFTGGTLSGCMDLPSSSGPNDYVCNFTPAADYTDDVSFTYQVTDNSGATAQGTIVFDITNIADNPVWADQSFDLTENWGAQPFTLSAATDPDNDITGYTLSTINPPTLGTVENCLDQPGSDSVFDLECTYLPNPGIFGTDTFEMTVTDSNSATDTITVTINIGTNNRYPVAAQDQTYTLDENNGSNTITNITIDSAFDYDGDTLTYSLLSSGGNGTLGTIANFAGTSFDYTPPLNIYGDRADYVLYEVTDLEGASDTGTIWFNLTSKNQAPNPFPVISPPLMLTVNEDDFNAPIVLTSTTDPDTDNLIYNIVRNPTKGTLEQCLGKTFTALDDLSCNYRMDSDIFADLSVSIAGPNFDRFTYRALDPEGLEQQLEVQINIAAVDSLPYVVADTFYLTFDEGINGVTLYLEPNEGGRPDEDVQNLVVRASSSDQAIVNDNTGFQFAYDDYGSSPTFTNNISPNWFDLGDGVADSAAKQLFVKISSEPGILGSTVISLDIAQDDGVVTNVRTHFFYLTVNSFQFKHGGWENIVAIGREFDPTASSSFDVTGNSSNNDDFYYGHFEPYISFSWNQMEAVTNPSEAVTGYVVLRSLEDPALGGNWITASVITDPTNRVYVESDFGSIGIEKSTSIGAAQNVNNAQVVWYRVLPVYDTDKIGGFLSTSVDEAQKTLRIVLPPDNKVLVHRWQANIDACQQLGYTSLEDSGWEPENHYRCLYQGPGSVVGTDSGGTQQNYYDLGYDLLVDRFEAGCVYSRRGAETCATGSGSLGFDYWAIGDGTSVLDTTFGSQPDMVFYDRRNAACYIMTTTGLPADCTTGNTWTQLSSDNAPFGTNLAPDMVTVLGSGGIDYVFNVPGNPPLVNVTQREASELCGLDTMDVNVKVLDSNSTLVDYQGYTGLSNRLPSHKEYIASAQYLRSGNQDIGWIDDRTGNGSIIGSVDFDASTNEPYVQDFFPTTSYEHGLITGYESGGYEDGDYTASSLAGSSISTVNQCHTWNDLTYKTGRVDILDTTNFPEVWDEHDIMFKGQLYMDDNSGAQAYPLPSGSFNTLYCSSRYGLQDHVGQSAEWVTDRFNCTSTTVCTALTAADPNALPSLPSVSPDLEINHIDSGMTINYGFDGITGPDLTTANNYSLSDDTANPNGYFILPLGLPLDDSTAVSNYNLPSSSGLLNRSLDNLSVLHDDKVDIDITNIRNGILEPDIAAMSVGGGHSRTISNSGEAGIYHFELKSTDANYQGRSSYTGFRCGVEIPYP